ncbi:MAG: choice-of-anchor E domain-containing protein [Verrucomicrobia bacterium]|nr:choice-of-anchor E domain-containing protein [Verrucomicrobiota bacterium]
MNNILLIKRALVVNPVPEVATIPKRPYPVRPFVLGRKLSLCATLAIVLTSGLADVRADTIYWNESGGLVPRFDPAYGRLTSVALAFAGNWQTKNGVYNPTQFDTSYSFSFSMPINAGVAGTGLWASGSLTYNWDGIALAMSYSEGPWKMDGTFVIFDDTSLAADLDFFTGTDPVQISAWYGEPSLSVSPSYLQVVPVTFGWAGSASGSYTYEPVPASSTLTQTFRTTAALKSVFQGTDLAGKPAFEYDTLEGHDLVNLALGTSLTTLRTNELLALDIDCGSTVVSLVVFSKTLGTNIATIATNTTLDVVTDQGNAAAAFPNKERFVAQMVIQAGGNTTNGLVSGQFTLAGRLQLNPTNGCPQAVLKDHDKFDRIFRDIKFKTGDDKLEVGLRDVHQAGEAHLIGVVTVVVEGTTTKVLIPFGALSLKRQLNL